MWEGATGLDMKQVQCGREDKSCQGSNVSSLASGDEVKGVPSSVPHSFMLCTLLFLRRPNAPIRQPCDHTTSGSPNTLLALEGVTVI